MTLDPRITFSRTSLGTYYGADGLLKYAGHNLLFRSQEFDHANWTKSAGATVTADATTAPDGTTTADRLNHVTAGTVAGGYVNQSTATAIDRGLISVYAKAGTKNWLVIDSNPSIGTTPNKCWFDLSTGTVGTKGTAYISSGMTSVGGGWYRCWALCLFSVTGATIGLRVAEANSSTTCTSPGDIYIWGAQSEYVTTETTPRTYYPNLTSAAVHGPRLDYDPVTHVARGLLIEEARTNQLNGSQDFTNVGYTKTGVTVTADQTTAPDGTTTADLITASASPGSLSQSTIVTTSVSFVCSVFAKKGTSDWFYLAAQTTGTVANTPKAWFNLALGTVGTIESPLTAATIQAIGNGWYRCTVARISSDSGEFIVAGISDADTSTTVTVGRTIYLWGAQVEPGGATFATSYFPVNGNRAADVAVMTGTNFSSWYNASAGTFVVEFDAFSAFQTRNIMEATDGTANERITLQSSFSSDGFARATVVDGGSTVAGLIRGTVTLNVPQKFGLSFALNDFAACLNGAAVGTDTAGTLPTVTTLRIGNDGSFYLNGHLRRIRFYNVAKSDAELITLTT